MTPILARGKRLTSVVTVFAMVATSVVAGVLFAPAAQAALSGVVPRVATVVTSDVLPTVQIDGVAWGQAVVGNTVYVAGKFTTARPAGAAAGVNTTARANLLAYNLTTGELLPFNHVLNAQALTIAVSPDKSRIYVAGDFTTVDGLTRKRIAAFSTATGDLISSFAPNVGFTTKAIAATNTTVYIGGSWQAIGVTARSNIAALNASDGKVTAWNPGADAVVDALLLTPDGSKLIVGGAFANLGGASAGGLGALDPVTGARIPWAAEQTIINTGSNSAITSLTTDGSNVYGTGYRFAGGVGGSTGRLEGMFSAAQSGALRWVEDCHGDSYSSYAANGVVYAASHAHYCGNVGGHNQMNPQEFQHAMAFTTDATGTVGKDPWGYFNFEGTPSPSIVNWFPELAIGSTTGLNQAAWSVTGNSQYVVYGGEFPRVNGIAQQGLVRFAVRPVSPGKDGPVLKGTNFAPTISGAGPGKIRVSFLANYDRDDRNLSYRITRNNVTVYTTTADSTWWDQPGLGFTDSGLNAGTTYSYRIFAADPNGNESSSLTVPFVAPSSGGANTYGAKVIADGASLYFPLNETSGTVVYNNQDTSPGNTNNNGKYGDADAGTGVTWGAAGTMAGTTAATFDGTVNGTIATREFFAAPNTFTISAWVKTSSTTGGKIIGLGNGQVGNSVAYDRQLYLDNSGRANFAASPNNTVVTVSGTQALNNNQWHLVTGSMGANGMVLYVDGVQVGARPDITSGKATGGYWRIGGDNLTGAANKPTSNYLAGAIDEVAIFPTAISRQTVRAEYLASGRTLSAPSAPTDTYGAAVYSDDPDLFWRLGEASGTTAQDSGQNGNQGDYVGTSVLLGQAGAITGTTNTAARFNGGGTNTSFAVAKNSVTNPTAFSLEAWFKTTTVLGGKIIGLGNLRSGLSATSDRHVYMQNDGKLVFGVSPGGTAVKVTTTGSFNNGAWHHVVATQGADGMKLYVDGVLQGTNATTGGQSYTGYWRVGGDKTGGSTNSYFVGTIDDVSVYSTALPADRVSAHYTSGSGGGSNSPPTAAFTTTKANLALSVDGSTSSDPDGPITSYAWDFGDTATGTGATASHTYSAAGTYPVTLTVTDGQGGTNTSTQSVTVAAANQAPVADFSSTVTDLSVAFDASTSADADGTIASYAWTFGDSASGIGVTPSHDYTTAGTYSVTLTVTDDAGATSTKTRLVTATAPPVGNMTPTADFSATVTNLAAAFDASASSDPDGTIASYAWTFGDSGTGTGAAPSHTYASAGTYSVKLTVTDNQGGVGTTTKSVTVTNPVPGNVAPVASFTATATGLSVALNATASSDSDGTIASYAWDFGDTTSGTGSTATHPYSVAGTYTVKLTVTDNDGGTGTSSKSVTVVAPAGPNLAVDTFSRAVTNGLGTADTGGNWTLSGTGTNFAVANGVGTIKMSAAASGPSAYLSTVSGADVDATVNMAFDKDATGGGTYASLAVRRNGTSDYRAKVRYVLGGSVQVSLVRLVSGAETSLGTITVPGLSYAVGDTLQVRLNVAGSGTTTLSSKVWKVGTTEPADWQITRTDTTAGLQSAGGVGLAAYLSGSSTQAPALAIFDNLSVRSQ